MKTTITFNVLILAMLMSFTTYAQTHVYNETTPASINDIYFWSNPNANGVGSGSEVSNPLPSDELNSSANALVSGTNDSWSQIQFLNTSYTVSSGDKLFFSVYDPNGVGKAQIRFEYSGGSGWEDGGDVSYATGSDTGWEEVSLSLGASVGKEIIKVILMPGYDTNSAVYIDNVYFHTESIFSTPPAETTTHIYNETTSPDLYFWSNPNANGDGSGSEVSNPLPSDALNSSANVLVSGTNDSWSQIQFLNLSFTPSTGDKLFFSVYDPNGVGKGQIKFEYSGSSNWEDGGDVTYLSGTDQGWKEHSMTLDPNAGNQIVKVIFMPGYDTNSAVYIDNIYVASSSTLSTRSIEVLDGFVFFDTEGRINFEKNQTDVELKVYDLTGRLHIQENLKGRTSKSSVSNRGVYILKVSKDGKASTKKLFFR